MLFSPTQQHPQQSNVTVLTLVAGLYEAEEYTGEAIVQLQFKTLTLTAEQVLRSHIMMYLKTPQPAVSANALTTLPGDRGFDLADAVLGLA